MKNKKTLFIAIIVMIVCVGVYFGSSLLSYKETKEDDSKAIELVCGDMYDLLYFYVLDEDTLRDCTEVLEIVGPDGNKITIPEKNEDNQIIFIPNIPGKYDITFEETYIPTEEETNDTGLMKRKTTCTYPFIVN